MLRHIDKSLKSVCVASFSALSATMVKAGRWILAEHFHGEPKFSDFELQEEELPPLKDGEILCQAEWLSIDPYMRAYSVRVKAGSIMMGSQVAKVIESRSKDFKVGQYIVGYMGWQSHVILHIDGPDPTPGYPKPTVLPDMGGLSRSLALGVLGMPGNTAYFGFLEICQPKAGEVVVVSGAAGAVGSHVGQIAKIKGCKVIGFAGSDDKVRWLKNDLKFDHAFNYKTVSVTEALKEAAPEGVDCYFDNVGGTLSGEVINQMRTRGRVSVCGSISAYNADVSKMPVAPVVQPAMVFKELMMEGFLVHRWLGRWNEGIQQNITWIKEGKLKYHETVTEGFKNMPTAFIGMLRGENTGKAVIKA